MPQFRVDSLSASRKTTQGLIDSSNHILFLGPSQLNLHPASHAPRSSSRTRGGDWVPARLHLTHPSRTVTPRHTCTEQAGVFHSRTQTWRWTLQKERAWAHGRWKYAATETTWHWTCWGRSRTETAPPQRLPRGLAVGRALCGGWQFSQTSCS